MAKIIRARGRFNNANEVFIGRDVLVYLLCCAVLLFGKAASAQEQFRFESFGVDEGLPQSSVWSVIQDRQGFIWVGTADGCSRFDGFGFQPIGADREASIAIKGQVQLHADRNGDILIAYKNGITKYEVLTGKLKEITKFGRSTPGEVFNKIIGQDNKGNIWCALPGVGIIKVDSLTGKQSAPLSLSATGKPDGNSQIAGFINKQQELWAANLAGGIFCYDLETKVIRKFLPDVSSYAMLPLNDSVIAVAHWGNLILFNTKTFRHQLHHIFDGRKGRGTPGNILDICKDNSGKLWLCTEHGIYLYDLAKGFVSDVLYTRPSAQEGFSYAYTAFCDRSGNVWVGTNGDGLKKLAHSTRRFLHFEKKSAGGSMVKSVYMQDSLVFSGLYENGVDIFHLREGFLGKVNPFGTGPDAGTVYAMAKAGRWKVLMYNTNEAVRDLYLFDTKTRDAKSLNDRLRSSFPQLGFNTNNFPFLTRLKDSSILFPWEDRLFSMQVQETGKVAFTLIRKFNGIPVTCALEVSAGRLYVGSFDRFYFKDSGKDWMEVKLPQGTLVKTFCEADDGRIWVGTITGIYIFDGQRNEMWHFGKGNGLPNDFIYGLLKDRQGDIWASHNKGLSRYDIRRKRFFHFNKEDGLQSNEFNTGAYNYGEHGALLFGGINGVNLFYPDRITANLVKPELAITSIRVFEKLYRSDTAPEHIRSLSLPWNENSLSFEFAALEHTNSDRNQYAYMLEGLDRGWIDGGNRRFVRYPSLQP
ncbi:MAG: hypothetical protein EOP49_12425, partial [Sphingobacteriales bacterium]